MLRPPAPRDLSGSTAERVTDALRQEILAGLFAPGSRLKIQALAARYGVSPLPVREALRRLEGERLLDLSAHRGASIRGVTARYVRNVYDVREAIESLLAERAAERVKPGSLAALERRATAWEDAARLGDPAALLARNLDFHAAIAAIADNPEAEELIPRGWQMTMGLRMNLGFSDRRIAAIRQEHRGLVSAIAARDPEAARRLSRLHVRSACDELLARLAEARLLPEDDAA